MNMDFLFTGGHLAFVSAGGDVGIVFKPRPWYGFSAGDFVEVLRYMHGKAQRVCYSSYSAIGDHLGRRLGQNQYSFIAWMVNEYSRSENLGLLGSLIVRKGRSMPGPGFNEYVKTRNPFVVRRYQRKAWQQFRELDADDFVRNATDFWYRRQSAWRRERGLLNGKVVSDRL
jgi:hypothetical protein